MLFRVASAAQRNEIAATAGRAVGMLERLASELEAEWKRIASLPPDDYSRLAGTNRLQELEALGASGAYLLAWARLYQAMAMPASDGRRTELLTKIVDDVATRYRWTDQPHESSGLQMQALVLTTIGDRLAGRFDAADAAARQAIGVYSRVSAERRRGLDNWALLAVLEQIRILRDRGQTADAAAAVQRAYTWAKKTRPDDTAAIVSLGILERTLAAPKAPAEDPLLAMARATPAARPLIYESVGELAREAGNAASLGDLDRLALVWVLTAEPAHRNEAETIARRLSAKKDDAYIASESLYLLARCQTAAARPTEAAESLMRLAREYPAADRAAEAVHEAVRLAAQGVEMQKHATAASQSQPTTRDVNGEFAGTSYAKAREVFALAVDMLRDRSPQDARLPELSFAAGMALQQLQRWPQAAAQFAEVAASHRLGAEAAVRQARCLAKEFERKPTSESAAEAMRAAAAARKRIEDGADAGPNLCWAAEVALLRAGIQADSAVRQYEDAIATLDDFENRYASCTDLVGSMWRVRLTALESLGRLKEANALVERVAAAEPQRAGAVMSGLLARLRDRIEAARTEGDGDAVRDLSEEAAKLAEQLERWTASRSPRAQVGAAAPSIEAVRLARAMALLDAGRVKAARRIAETQPADATGWQFVRAECMYRERAYREALPIFNQVWRAEEEARPLWWRALLRNLQCHTEVGTDPQEILQSIRQYEHRYRDLGGPALRREFEALKAQNERRQADRQQRPS